MASSSPRLTVLGGSLAGKELSIEDAVDNVLIGSDPSCRFCLQVPGVSPIHARLWVDPQGITVYDTNAPQGLFVNDDRVSTQAALRNGDILWLGTPGQDDVVMIQCRIASRGASAQAPGASKTAPPPPPEILGQGTDETAVLSPPAGALSSSDFESLDEPALEPIPAGRDEQPRAPVLVEPDSEPIDQTVVMGVAMEETAYAPPSALTPPPPPLRADAFPPPPAFEQTTVLESSFVEPPPVDQTETEWRPPAAVPPPPMALPVVSPVFEEDIDESATARIESQATVHVPAPPPPPPAPPRPAPVLASPPPHAPAPRASAAVPKPAAPPPQPAKRPAAKSGGGAGMLVGAAAVLFVVLGGAAAGWYFFLGPGAAPPVPSVAPPMTLAQAPTPEPTSSLAPPSAEPTPEPSVEETVTLVPPPSLAPSALPSASGKPVPSPSAAKPSPAATGKPTPVPTQAAPDPGVLRAQQVATLVSQADAALGEKRFDAAASLYDQALQLDPQNGQAARGKSSAQASLSASRRSLVAGRSTLIGAKTDKKLSGFDSEDVSLAKAPDYSGRLDFEASPKSPQSGDSYTVRVYLTNDGKKPFKIASFSATTNASGEKSGGPMAPATKEIQPQQKALVQEISGVWREGATSWALDVSVVSGHGESIRNTLTWR